jgi:deoxyribodipyrimidine photo-lyase
MTRFPTNRQEILLLLEKINPEKYAKSRNYIDGAVTYLSPYISRGVLSTRDVFDFLKKKNHTWNAVEKLVQELAWRDFFQMVWIRLGSGINSDIKQEQFQVLNHSIPSAIFESNTGINGIDSGIQKLYDFGYMHNHQRMYTASIVCNIASSHWREPARWMYYHLLDADWASNACSWQWVAGSFSNKKYYANQENINRYCNTNQHKTYLDVNYDEFANVNIPRQLIKTEIRKFQTELPETASDFNIDSQLPVLLYNWYNLDFRWLKDQQANRVLLLEPDIFAQYPICERSIKFMLDLSKNISGIQIFTGSFESLSEKYPNARFIFKEHPLNQYTGEEHSRSFLQPISKKSFNSFFGFWKSIEKNIAQEFEN